MCVVTIFCGRHNYTTPLLRNCGLHADPLTLNSLVTVMCVQPQALNRLAPPVFYIPQYSSINLPPAKGGGLKKLLPTTPMFVEPFARKTDIAEVYTWTESRKKVQREAV